MKRKGIFSALGILLVAGVLSTGYQHLCEIVPENDLYIPAGIESINGITEAKFNEVITKVEKHYKSKVKARGGNLTVRRLWDDGTVNASAQRIFNLWVVNMYGGLARHSTITPDGFALVMCHELGHHIGGAPKLGSRLGSWASNEGQSDYFANLKCLRTVWWSEDNVAIVNAMKDVDEYAEDACADAFENDNEAAICIRGAMAGRSVAGLFQALRNETEPVQFDTPDGNVVQRTDDTHPGSQCRLDTYFQGSLCQVAHTKDVATGDAKQGTCNRSTGDKLGVRPLCWYKPN